MTKNTLPPDTKKKLDADIVYVDIDALLDTRLGTLALLNNEYAVNALMGDYTSRSIDSFPDVPYEIFKKAYEKRNVDTLMLSTFTDVFVLLNSCVKSTFEAAATNVNTKPLQIQVNVFPYDLDEEEMAEISVAVWSRLKEMADVNVVNISDAFLTPQYCKDTYTMMVRYDYQSWLKIHHDSHAFEKTKMPEVSIVSPALYQKYPNEQELTELKEQNIHPFTAVELTMSPFFTLRLTDVSVFCISKQILEAKNKDSIEVEKPKLPDSNAIEVNNPEQPNESHDAFDSF
jgi:hypothetical protein